MSRVRTNIPDFRLTLDGKDLTGKVRPRLISLNLAEKRGGEADQLDLVLDDSDGLLEIPKAGVRITLQLGWLQGAQVQVGLVDKGEFTVDEVEHRDPPAQVTIRARSADLTAAAAKRREKSWHDTTLGAIVREIGGRNGWTVRIAPDLAALPLKSFAQDRESDVALLRRLGREHDAVATIKQATLIFNRIGAGTTTTGKETPVLTIARSDGDGHSYRVEKREEAKGVTASWHDRKGAKKKHVTVGESEGARRLSRTYPTEAAARTAAQAELKQGGRQPVSLSLNLALGRPDLMPERKVKASGFKAPIDAHDWLIAELTHSLSDRGLTTSIKLEATS